MQKFLAWSLSDAEFLMLINIKMPQTVLHFDIYKQDKIRA